MFYLVEIFCIIYQFNSFLQLLDGISLNEYVTHYEVLNYNTQSVNNQHIRAKRDLESKKKIHLTFHSHGHTFNIRLKKDTSVIAPDVILDVPENHDYPDFSHLYSGHVLGDSNSRAFGSIREGIFDGSITISNETFFIERSQKYFMPGSSNDSFHSVIYSENAIIDPYKNLRSGSFRGCGLTNEVADWMHKIQNSFIENVENNDIFSHFYNQFNKCTSQDSFYHPYSVSDILMELKSREKRRPQPPKTTCTLSIRTDPLFWSRYFIINGGDVKATRDEIIAVISQHVAAVNNIYEGTKFDGKYNHRHIRFQVQRIKIDNDSECHPSWKGSPNEFCRTNLDVSNFLNLQSQDNHDAFCLAYVFTYRDFTGGTLGLAWVASPTSAGGICERHKEYMDRGPLTQRVLRSLNTGIISFVNYNSAVPPKVSQLTLAHEIGHNFGSPHDFPSECTPGGKEGNYIMFSSATSVDKPNNSRFSPCSVANISLVLDALMDGAKANCFTTSEGAFCGNRLLEDGEECDCGFDLAECGEYCCYPRHISEQDKLLNPNAQQCHRRPGKICSPSEGKCCSQNCSFISSWEKVRCAEATECAEEAYCGGNSSHCPKPVPKADLTPCNGQTQVCKNGECSESYCIMFGMEPCFLSSSAIVDRGQLCELACQQPGNLSSCLSTAVLMYQLHLSHPILLQPGSPCDNYQGYCDVFRKCRAIDAEGPLLRIKKILFSKENLNTFSEWLTEYWWAALLSGVSFTILMSIFIKCCAVHTPSNNPNYDPHIRWSDTLHHPGRHRRPHHRQQPYYMGDYPLSAPVPGELRLGHRGHRRNKGLC